MKYGAFLGHFDPLGLKIVNFGHNMSRYHLAEILVSDKLKFKIGKKIIQIFFYFIYFFTEKYTNKFSNLNQFRSYV